MVDNNGYKARYEEMVLGKLNRIEDSVEQTKRDVSKIQAEMTGLKVKASLWGFVAGAMPGIGVGLAIILSNLL